MDSGQELFIIKLDQPKQVVIIDLSWLPDQRASRISLIIFAKQEASFAAHISYRSNCTNAMLGS